MLSEFEKPHCKTMHLVDSMEDIFEDRAGDIIMNTVVRAKKTDETFFKRRKDETSKLL